MKILRAYALSYPAALLLALFITYWAGRVSLGHWPRPSLDDPKFIGGWVDVPYGITLLLLMVGFPVFVIAVLGQLHHACMNEKRRKSFFITSALSIAGMTATACILLWDPMNVVSWFMD